ncbi:MAG TPA: hypothetical protein VHM20_00875 [Gammaproteobacteria bacterium]|jgi:hypothetical protein|nr:hypothetical protein [Gammaproteobacteria bacterium]
MHGTIGIIAGILSLVGYIPYIKSILERKTQPNKATWIIWAIVGGLLAFSYAAEGDPNSIWLPLGYFLGPLIVAILSFYYGYSEWSKLDYICLGIALLSILPWILSKHAYITLLINVFIDMMGAIPTIIKTYKEPETEDLTAWVIFCIANTIQLFAISIWNLAAVYPIYLFFLASTLVILIVKGKIRSTPSIK